MTARLIDRGGHFLLGSVRADGADHGECGWTLLADNLFAADPHRVARLERMPYPPWWNDRIGALGKATRDAIHVRTTAGDTDLTGGSGGRGGLEPEGSVKAAPSSAAGGVA